jgi:alpha-acetolactate decarboxylase
MMNSLKYRAIDTMHTLPTKEKAKKIVDVIRNTPVPLQHETMTRILETTMEQYSTMESIVPFIVDDILKTMKTGGYKLNYHEIFKKIPGHVIDISISLAETLVDSFTTRHMNEQIRLYEESESGCESGNVSDDDY